MVNYWVLLLCVGKTEQENTSNPALTIVNAAASPSLSVHFIEWTISNLEWQPKRNWCLVFPYGKAKKRKMELRDRIWSWSFTGGLWGDRSAAILASVSQCVEGTLRLWQTPASFTSKTTVKAESGHELPQKWSICEFIFPLNFNVENFQHTQKWWKVWRAPCTKNQFQRCLFSLAENKQNQKTQ